MTIDQIKKNIVDLLKKTVPDIPKDFIFEFKSPPQSEMGDLCLSCFKIGQELKKSPAEMAKKIEKILDVKISLIDIVDKIKSTGPYLNIFLEKSLWFELVLEEILNKNKNFGANKKYKEKKFLIEYSSPNTNKPQHLGHLRNNFLGGTMANLFAFSGAKVSRVNLVNDRGVHICQSILAYQKWGENKTPETENKKSDHFVGDYYVLFHKKAKDDPDLLIQAQEMLRKWEQGDVRIIALWQKMNKWAIEGFKETYRKIGINFDYWYFESDIYDFGRKIVQKALKRGLCYKREDKAIEIDLTDDGLNKKVLLRPDGTSVYITQDIGLAKLKQEKFNPDKSVYVVASEQDYHFKVLFRILEIFGFDWVKNCYHLSYNLVFLPGGKMKSRQGKTADADNIIIEMEKLAKGEIINRNPNLSPQKVSQRATIIALAALKFFLLKYTPQQEVHFDPKQSLSFEGNSGLYVLYVYVRIQGILEKTEKKDKKERINYNLLNKKEEIEILRLLFEFPQIINKSTGSYNPSCLANYLLDLGKKFNEFYHQYSVIKAEKEIKQARLILISAVAEVIKKGLDLLGIETLDKM